LSLNSKATIAGGNLTIMGLERDDAGLYECVATNVVASTVAATLLIVECKHAQLPIILSRIQSVAGDFVVIFHQPKPELN